MCVCVKLAYVCGLGFQYWMARIGGGIRLLVYCCFVDGCSFTKDLGLITPFSSLMLPRLRGWISFLKYFYLPFFLVYVVWLYGFL